VSEWILYTERLNSCDFCHVNHQPCDNAKPRCSYCERHNKPCLYLRPQKKRGPAQGYRTALQGLRESAAAWGAALQLIPSLGPVVEGYLQGAEGRRLAQAVKDPTQQEFFIQAWQHSGVYKAFFGDNPPSQETACPDAGSIVEGDGELHKLETPEPASLLPQQPPGSLLQAEPPLPKFDTILGAVPTPSPSQDGGKARSAATGAGSSRFRPRQESISLSDIVAKDAARS